MKLYNLVVCLLLSVSLNAQHAYKDSLKKFQENYVATHEVVKGDDKVYFRFFPINSNYRVSCSFEKLTDVVGFTMKTSGAVDQHFYKYGRIHFKLKDTALQLYIYQSKDLMKVKGFENYLFLPFTDNTTGDESYGSGRYVDLLIEDIVNNKFMLDLNKAYNPYCAYVTGFNCPLPPRENFLNISIYAGEKSFGKPIH